MNILILGAGRIGAYLAGVLSGDGHDVIVLDKDSKALEKVGRYADVATKLGSGTDWRVYAELAERSPHLLIALSGNDATNLVACSIAKNLGFPKTVARMRSTSYFQAERLDFNRLFFVDDFIGVELIVAHDIFNQVRYPGNVSIENFAHGAVQMRTIEIPKDWKEKQTKIVDLALHQNLLVGLIWRDGALIFPKGSDHIAAGDEVTFIGETKVMLGLDAFFGMPEKKSRRVTLFGGTAVALELAQILEEQKIEVQIIEPNEAQCKELAEALPYATILNQEITEASLERDAFVACTSSTETNILAGALAQHAGCDPVIALVSEAKKYAPLLKKVGITQIASERESIAKRIQSMVHTEDIVAISSLYDNRAKIVEVKVSPDSRIVGIPIANLRASLPSDFLIALIYNRGRVMIAKGSHILSPEDTVIIICGPKALIELEKTF